uniref:uncharacterized protein LOC122591580 n=1 Tax=Erigeron canadensis TaxID=72917 RepID=UPI001CB89161|nr:uncharacterized protein LOC122591580 [Erigeron canadensis]
MGLEEAAKAWYDKWADQCPLIAFIRPRNIRDAGLSLYSRLHNIRNGSNWLWPVAWFDLFPVLIDLPHLQLNNSSDKLIWKDNNASIILFSTWGVWNIIRKREQEVPWYKIVWFSQCILCHSFLMWLILQRKLKTQDQMMRWGGGGNLNMRLLCCSLCQRGPDSHNHLFFECDFSQQVWSGVKGLAGMSNVSEKLEDIMDWLMVRAKSRSVRSVIGRLLVAATTYYVWQ